MNSDLIEIQAKDLAKNKFFYLNKRKNAKRHYSAHIEIIEGEFWSEDLKNHPENEGKIFIMGRCGTPTQGQMIVSPETPIFIYE